MKDLLFIINPISGKGKNSTLATNLESILAQSDKSYDCILTKYVHHAIEIARDNADKYKLTVAVGGDGTINEVAKGLLSSNVKHFGIIPAGSGNDLSKLFNLSSNINDVIEVMSTDNYAHLDYISSSHEDIVLNIASFGLDSCATVFAQKYKKLLGGSLAYIFGTLEAMIKYRRKRIRLTVDGVSSNHSIILTAFGNGKYYGGNIPILPWAKKDDGVIHGVLVENISNLKTLFLLPTIFTGSFTNLSCVKQFSGKNITIEPLDPGIIFNIDGEAREIKKPISFTIEQCGLSIKI